MQEGVVPRTNTYMMRVLNPMVCVACHQPIGRSAYALGAPYYCMLHTHCAPLFPFDDQYPHELPAVFYSLRRSQDDNGLPALRNS